MPQNTQNNKNAHPSQLGESNGQANFPCGQFGKQGGGGPGKAYHKTMTHTCTIVLSKANLVRLKGEANFLIGQLGQLQKGCQLTDCQLARG